MHNAVIIVEDGKGEPLSVGSRSAALTSCSGIAGSGRDKREYIASTSADSATMSPIEGVEA
jgi:hypothetical protein